MYETRKVIKDRKTAVMAMGQAKLKMFIYVCRRKEKVGLVFEEGIYTDVCV